MLVNMLGFYVLIVSVVCFWIYCVGGLSVGDIVCIVGVVGFGVGLGFVVVIIGVLCWELVIICGWGCILGLVLLVMLGVLLFWFGWCLCLLWIFCWILVFFNGCVVVL